MFTIADLLRDTVLEDSLKYFSREHQQYNACNLLATACNPDKSTLWITGDPSDCTCEMAKGTGIVIVCRTSPENVEKYDELFPKCEIAVLVTDQPVAVIYSQLQSAAVKRIKPLLDEAALAESLITKRTLTEIVDQATAMLQNPVILTTSSYRVLAMNDAGIPFDDPVWNAAVENGYCSAESIMHFESENITRQVWQSKEAFVLDKGLAKMIPRILQKIEVSGKVGAYIGVFQIEHTFNGQDLKMVDMICRILSVMMERDPKILNYTTEICQSILLELLNGKITSAPLLHDRVCSAYWKPYQNFRCAILLPEDSVKGIPNADYILHCLSYQLPGAKIIQVDNGLMVLLNYSGSGIKEPYESVLRATAEKYELLVGISNEFRDLIKLRCYYSTALETISINRMLHTGRRLTYFCDIIFYALANRVNAIERTSYIQSKYKLLAEYDRENDTEFCKTLVAYIDCGCSSNLASQKLFIHRNTISHRLERITEISKINLKDGQELFHFFLSNCIAEWNTIDNQD